VVKTARLGKAIEVIGIPKPILVNAEGIIIATDLEIRDKNLKKTLAKYLNTTMQYLSSYFIMCKKSPLRGF